MSQHQSDTSPLSGLASAAGVKRPRESLEADTLSNVDDLAPKTEETNPPSKRLQVSAHSGDGNQQKDDAARPATWDEWQRLRTETGIRSVARKDDFDDGNAHDLAQKLVAFPLQFGFSTGGPVPNGQNGSTQNAPATPTAPASGQGVGVGSGPSLSSVRSSADHTHSANGGAPPTDSSSLPPELRFTDETLHSAGEGASVLEAAIKHAQSAAADAAASGHDGHDVSRLAPPSSESPGGTKKEQPFSRSPELRINHKLAERKRRKEMKDLFDELRELLPAERGSKSSKWEILSKGMILMSKRVLTTAIDHITYLKESAAEAQRDLERTRRELDVVRGGNAGYVYPSYAPTFVNAGAYPPGATPAPASGTSPAAPAAPAGNVAPATPGQQPTFVVGGAHISADDNKPMSSNDAPATAPESSEQAPAPPTEAQQ